MLVNAKYSLVSRYDISFSSMCSLKEYFFTQFDCRKPCKTGYKYLEDGTKVRVSRGMYASGAVIPRPEILKERKKPRPTSGMCFISTSFLLIISYFSTA
jgi:hypothetical protein